MKATVYISAVAAVLLMAACSSDNEVSVLPESHAIEISAAVGSSTTTRSEVSLDSLKRTSLGGFGMFVINSSDPTYTYLNYRWKWFNGHWTSFRKNDDLETAEVMEWKDDKTPVTVIAYFPTKDSWTDVNIDHSLNYATQSAITSYDMIYAQSEVTPNAPVTTNDIYYDKGTQRLNVKMNHRMAKFNIILNFGTEFNDPNNGNASVDSPVNLTYASDMLSLIGPYTQGYWNLSTDVITLYENKDARIAKITNSVFGNCVHYTKGVGTSSTDAELKGGVATFEFVVLPQEVKASDLRITFRMISKPDGTNTVYTPYVWIASSDMNFERGKQYSLTLNVGRGMVTTAAWEVSDWNTIPSGTITTDK